MGKRQRGIHLLSAKGVEKAGTGEHNDGGNLVLRVRADGASWVLRFTNAAGKRREMGLGVCHRNGVANAGASLVKAREDAEKARRLLRDGKDPIEAREHLKAEEKARAEASEKARKACRSRPGLRNSDP